MSQKDLIEYTRLKDKESRLDKEATKLAWELENLFAQLKKEFGVKTLEEARTLLQDLEQQEHTLGQKFRKALDKFKEEYDVSITPTEDE